MRRLTTQERLDRSLSERDWQAQVVDYARMRQWMVAHFRPALTEKGTWLTAVAADGAGFPDLCMVRGKRIIFSEIKKELGKPTDKQHVWLDRLGFAAEGSGTVEVYVWRPSDWPLIVEVLK